MGDVGLVSSRSKLLGLIHLIVSHWIWIFRVDDKFLVKLADFGMSKDVYFDDYFKRGQEDKYLPVKWMALESLREGRYDYTTEVVNTLYTS